MKIADERILKQQKLAETRALRMKAFNEQYTRQLRDRLHNFQNAQKEELEQLKTYERKVEEAKELHKVAVEEERERLWAAAPTAEDIAVAHADETEQQVIGKRCKAAQFDRFIKQQNDLIYREFQTLEQKRLQEAQEEEDRRERVQREFDERAKARVASQREYQTKREIALKEEALYAQKLEAKIAALSRHHVEVVKEPGIPVLVNRNKRHSVEIIPEDPGDPEDGFAGNAFHEATVRQQTVEKKTYPMFDSRKVSEQQSISRLAKEGLTLLEMLQGK